MFLTIDSQTALLFEGESRYDIILGRDFLHKAGIKIDFSGTYMEWLDQKVPMREVQAFTSVPDQV